jgi:hypothetical protein
MNTSNLKSNNIRSPPSTYDPSPPACNRVSSLPTAFDGYQRLPVTSCQVSTGFRWLAYNDFPQLPPISCNIQHGNGTEVAEFPHMTSVYVGVRIDVLANGGCRTHRLNGRRKLIRKLNYHLSEAIKWVSLSSVSFIRLFSWDTFLGHLPCWQTLRYFTVHDTTKFHWKQINIPFTLNRTHRSKFTTFRVVSLPLSNSTLSRLEV